VPERKVPVLLAWLPLALPVLLQLALRLALLPASSLPLF
jgi:hypothetical protein